MSDQPTCKHCGEPIEMWSGPLGGVCLHTRTGYTSCATTRAEPIEETTDEM